MAIQSATTTQAGVGKARTTERLLENRNVLGALFMLPAGLVLFVFLTYPLGLGLWLGLTAANLWRGIPFVAITLLAGLQPIPPSLYEAAVLDGASPWQRFWYITLPVLSPIIAVVMTFSVLFTFTDFQLIYVVTGGGPLNATHLMATLSFQRAITGGQLGEGAAIANAMITILLVAILFSYFGLQQRRWQQGAR